MDQRGAVDQLSSSGGIFLNVGFLMHSMQESAINTALMSPDDHEVAISASPGEHRGRVGIAVLQPEAGRFLN
jgi:hypothetical protein